MQSRILSNFDPLAHFRVLSSMEQLSQLLLFGTYLNLRTFKRRHILTIFKIDNIGSFKIGPFGHSEFTSTKNHYRIYDIL